MYKYLKTKVNARHFFSKWYYFVDEVYMLINTERYCVVFVIFYVKNVYDIGNISITLPYTFLVHPLILP